MRDAKRCTLQLERFDRDGHALLVDDPVNFNRMVEEFVQSLPKQLAPEPAHRYDDPKTWCDSGQIV
jgi:hypothetical protein